ncbi:AraC family transcriptional regulator [Acinetobacter sp.]|jgi:AraC-like DNA-binding protein|uniref:helix-turn-helix domain-containing protein n=1 Tax=Acinetobacter sp. TaxID=472 RepID=UPI00281B591A|nr:AraC family transcriptional regulator [Acinetobacter sp.]MDR0237091.1 AraC family transcriptional regulator [Acinetobacter sp.]
MMEAKKEIIFDKLVYSCAFQQHRGLEEFISEHFLGFQMSGETHAFDANGQTVIKENSFVLVKKNQLIRTMKYPSSSGKYQFVSITLDHEELRQYALENKIVLENHHKTKQMLFLEPNDFLSSYFLSLSPYVNKTKEATPRLAALKIREAIELLLQINPDLKYMLFDFSEPFKIDLEKFMNQNYMFNVSVAAFAILTGRSTSGFKRDFAKIFHTTPKRWLRERRLEEAIYRIKYKKEKPTDFYLDLGFENLSHFYSAFKQKFGLTTSELLSEN